MKRILLFFVVMAFLCVPGRAQNQASATLTLTVTGTAPAAAVLPCPIGNVCAAGMILTGPYPAAAGVDVPIIFWSIFTGSVAPVSVSGYNIYRSSVSGGPYTLLNPAAFLTVTSYTDSAVVQQQGLSYYYVISSISLAGISSPYSNEVQIVVP